MHAAPELVGLGIINRRKDTDAGFAVQRRHLLAGVEPLLKAMLQVVQQRAAHLHWPPPGQGTVCHLRAVKLRIKKCRGPVPLGHAVFRIMEKAFKQRRTSLGVGDLVLGITLGIINGKIAATVVGWIKERVGPATLSRTILKVVLEQHRPVPGCCGVCFLIVGRIKQRERMPAPILGMLKIIGKRCRTALIRGRGQR